MFNKCAVLTTTLAILGLGLVAQKLPTQAATLTAQPAAQSSTSLSAVAKASQSAQSVQSKQTTQGTQVALAESAEVALANYLRESGAKVYGSYNCFYTLLQLQMFSKSLERVPYVECNANSRSANTGVCQMANVRSTPTWEINGHIYKGVKSLQQLAQLSGYQGSLNFQSSQGR